MVPLTSAGITVAGLVSLSKFVGKHIDSVPSTILALFQFVIEARTATHAAFQQMTARTPDPDPNSSPDEPDLLANTEHVKEELDRLLANKFGALDIQRSPEADEASDQEDPQEIYSNVSRQRKQTKPGKGKKGKKGKAKKSSKPKTAPAKEDSESLEGVPLESYRIIKDQDGIVTDYLMAVYDLIKQCMTLRNYLQGIWREVAYDGLNSAVAGALSNVAIAMVQRSASEIFVDFPDHDSYETVMNTITRGNVEKAQGMFHVFLMFFEPGSDTPQRRKSRNIKELFLIRAYMDLLDFIRNWDPNFDLRHATKEERIRWRRSYTINWLYDLVHFFSSIVVQRNTLRGEKHVYEKVDWSPTGPWAQHRRLSGLNEFAGFVTSLAMQKPGTDVRNRILPHHVFQLQCIVDSLTVTRGWSHHLLKGHVVVAPPPSYRFRPRRDVDCFLDREVTRDGRGIPQAFDYMHGLNTIPPSRFSHTNANGLWEYSPFLCGTGLEEGLELAYISGMTIWDRLPEPMMLLHLHNMLVQEGYIEKPVGLFATLQELFPECFFPDGTPPVANYDKALQTMVDNRGSSRERQQVRRVATSAADIHGILNPKVNDFFRKKSTLVILREAGWNIDRIPDADVSFPSVLGMLRITQAKHITDHVTGKKRIEETEITKRAKAMGMSEENMFNMAETMEVLQATKTKANEIPAERVAHAMAPGYSRFPGRCDPRSTRKARMAAGGECVDFADRDMLDFMKLDIQSDISGERPLSALNFLWATTYFYTKRLSLTLLAMIEQDKECLEDDIEFVAEKVGQDPRPRPRSAASGDVGPDLDQCLVM
ncbi:hypothetical protein B0T13DRAFT_485579 [Neurospora crassa]|nr:hypothetical protein B0T13DRAFT_485579 [Neurospora crassa]